MDPLQYKQKMIESMKGRTGRTLDEWVELVKDQPIPDKHRDKLRWFKEQYGLGQNTAFLILESLPDHSQYSDESVLVDKQFTKENAPLRPLYDRLVEFIQQLGEDVKVRPGKTYIPFYRNKLFAIAKPYKGQLHIGLALPDTPNYAYLDPAKGLGASARITKKFTLTEDDLQDGSRQLLREAYELG